MTILLLIMIVRLACMMNMLDNHQRKLRQEKTNSLNQFYDNLHEEILLICTVTCMFRCYFLVIKYLFWNKSWTNIVINLKEYKSKCWKGDTVSKQTKGTLFIWKRFYLLNFSFGVFELFKKRWSENRMKLSKVQRLQRREAMVMELRPKPMAMDPHQTIPKQVRMNQKLQDVWVSLL